MLRSLTTAFSIWAIGCIVPTPLEAEVATNHPPVVVDGVPDFINPIISSNATTEVQLTFRARDLDIDQTLVARLYVLDGSGNFTLLQHAASFVASASDPTTRGGEFNGVFCAQTSSVPSPKLLFVFVADTNFTGSPTQLTDGHVAFEYWVLKCEGS